MAATIPYYFYKKIDGIDIYRKLLGDKYSFTYQEDGKYIGILFFFDDNGNPVIEDVYKNRVNYRAERYIRKYAENQDLVSLMLKVKE